ncbi:hypothetical protein AB0J86_11695 [Micromonospora sp. NPDC049559]|uniref:hypothetical protein n=1 Tax=Micromonospora sp. NPDC049559 TaxID=3155923 RepID=UPI003433B73C
MTDQIKTPTPRPAEPAGPGAPGAERSGAEERAVHSPRTSNDAGERARPRDAAVRQGARAKPRDPEANDAAARRTADGTGGAASGRDSDAWQEYVAAARQLDAVRRAAAAAAGEQAESVQTAHEELAEVRARLVPQRSRLRGLGVTELELTPSPPEVTVAARAMAAGPRAVLAALRQARGALELADARVTGGTTGPLDWLAGWSPWLRNLLAYGSFAALAVVGQLVFYVVAGGALPVLALLAGLLLPVAAFLGAWVTLGLVSEAAPGGGTSRTPLLGALVCLLPALLICAAAGLVRLATS